MSKKVKKLGALVGDIIGAAMVGKNVMTEG
jgi:hypothetical protein